MRKEILKKISEINELGKISLESRNQAEALIDLNDLNYKNKIESYLKKSIHYECIILNIIDEVNKNGSIIADAIKIQALNNIAWCYDHLKDHHQLLQTYQKLADLHDPEAVYLFANHCMQAKEYKKAASYFIKLKGKIGVFNFSASMGLYFHCLTPINIENCKKQYNLAAKVLQEMSFEERESKFTKLTEIEFYNNFGTFYLSLPIPDLVLARDYLYKAAQSGYRGAQYNLSVCLDKLEGPECRSAFEWCEKSANQGFALAQDSLARKLLFGALPEEQDEKVLRKAFHFFDQAAPIHLPAKVAKAAMLFLGLGVAKQIDQVIQIFKELTKCENKAMASCAHYNLGVIYFKEKNDLLTAITYFQLAVSENEANAENFMAFLYEFGIGVKINIKLAENLLKKSAQVYENAKIELLRFYKRQYKSGVMNLVDYTNHVSATKKIVPQVSKERHQIINIKLPDIFGKTEESKKDKDPFFIKINNTIVSISKNKKIYRHQKIRSIFANISIASELNNINVVTILNSIGSLFSAFNHLPQVISTYVKEITKIIQKVSNQCLEFTPRQIAMALDGLSKLHLFPDEKPLDLAITLLLNYAKTNVDSFNFKDLSMTVSAIIRFGLPFEMVNEYLPIFLRKTQDLWIKALKIKELQSLIHLAFMFAVLDVIQPPQEKRLVSFRLLGQLFGILKSELLELKAVSINYKSSNQLDLSLCYFIQHYPDHLKLAEAKELQKKYNFIKFEEKTTISEFQRKGTQFLMNNMAHPEKLRCEFKVNGLSIDTGIPKNLIAIPWNGPSHFLHSLTGKSKPIPTPIDRFHVALIEKKGFRVIPVNYFDWDQLSNQQKYAFFQKANIPLIASASPVP